MRIQHTTKTADDPRTEQAADLMLRFASRTGLVAGRAPRRYLWTDAFAVCNFLGLARRTGSARHRELAASLVDQVHHVLGRHRPDDRRIGWISELDDAEGELHPTIGGLRIGKPEPERGPAEPFDRDREWDRDGQYFHYLTKWMVALERLAQQTSSEHALRWARELADTAHHRFVIGRPGARRMVWKLSIDLQRPMVDSMGQHDPLDGLVTCLELDAAADRLGIAQLPRLDAAIAAFGAMIDPGALATADPLGLGGLLLDAERLTRLPAAPAPLVATVLDAAATGLECYVNLGEPAGPAERRLAFRELGLAIGLAAHDRLASDRLTDEARRAASRIERHARLRSQIEAFWLNPEHRATRTWTEHADINDVMLATALQPGGLLGDPS